MSMQEPIKDRHTSEPRVELTPTEARQGRLGRPVLVVLVVGLLLAMIAWAAAEFYGNAIAPADDTGGGQSITAPAANPASENENIVNDDPPAGDKSQTEPVIIDQQPTIKQ
jgi:hypothetical protein